MGPRSCSLYLDEDPWRASAFFFAFMQLLLTVLVLVHTVIVCITCQLMRWYGWGYPSCHDGIYQREATVSFDSGVVKEPFNLDSNGSRSTEFFLKRTRSEDWRALKSRSFICPKCYGVWNLKQGLSFRYDKGATSQLRETSAPSATDSSPIDRFSLLEAGTRSNAEYGSKACIGKKLAACQNFCFAPSGSTQKSLTSELAGKECNGSDEGGHGMLHLGSVNFNEDNCDTAGDTESCSNTPIHDLPILVKEVATEADVCRETLGEEVGSFSKEPRGNGLSRMPLKSVGSEVNLQSCELTPFVQKEIQEEIMDANFAAVPRKEGDNKECNFESVIKGLWDEQISALKDDCKSYDSESVIEGLKEAVVRERKKLCTLYAELEIERISSETAATEAMSMISRLQEQKAALRMQAAHYRRITEEKAIYDEQAMQLLKEILIKKEKENFLLEKEVKAMRTRFCRDVRIYGKRRQGVDRRSQCQGTLLLKNEGDVDSVHSPVRKSKGSGGELELPSPSSITEKQPFKRLKGNMDHENLSSQRILLASGVHANTQLALSGGDEMAHTHVYNSYCSCEYEHSVTTTKLNSCEEAFDHGLGIQEKATISEGNHVMSQNETLLDASKNRKESLEGLLKGSSTFSTAAESVQGWNCPLSDSSNNQASFPQVVEEDIAKKPNEGNQFGECSLTEQEAVCLDNGVILGLNTFAPCYSDEVSSSEAACAEETRDLGSTDVFQFRNMVLECNMRKDLHAREQIFQVDKVPQSFPSSLNHKGLVFNHLEESNSSLLRSHVH